jgi:hypothetical protein
MNWKLVLWVAATVVLGEAIAWGVFDHSTVSLWLLILVAASVSLIGGGLLAYVLRPRTIERTGQSTRP